MCQEKLLDFHKPERNRLLRDKLKPQKSWETKKERGESCMVLWRAHFSISTKIPFRNSNSTWGKKWTPDTILEDNRVKEKQKYKKSKSEIFIDF